MLHRNGCVQQLQNVQGTNVIKIFEYSKKIEEAYASMNYDQKAEFSECMKTISATEKILFIGGLALLLFKIVKK